MDNNNNFNGQNPYGNASNVQNQSQNPNQGYQQQNNTNGMNGNNGYQYQQQGQNPYQQPYQNNGQYQQGQNFVNGVDSFVNNAGNRLQSEVNGLLSPARIHNTDKLALILSLASNILFDIIYIIYCIFQIGKYSYSSSLRKTYTSAIIVAIIWAIVYVIVYAVAIYVKNKYSNNMAVHGAIGIVLAIFVIRDFAQFTSYLNIGSIWFGLGDGLIVLCTLAATVTSLALAYQLFQANGGRISNSMGMNGQPQQFNQYGQPQQPQTQQFNQYGQPQNMNQQYNQQYGQSQQNMGVNGLGANQPYMTGQQPQNMSNPYNQSQQAPVNNVQPQNGQSVSLDKNNNSPEA
jgi:hypothetical protein